MLFRKTMSLLNKEYILWSLFSLLLGGLLPLEGNAESDGFFDKNLVRGGLFDSTRAVYVPRGGEASRNVATDETEWAISEDDERDSEENQAQEEGLTEPQSPISPRKRKIQSFRRTNEIINRILRN